MIKEAGKYLFVIILIELLLGGGGRFFVFGPVTLRMILFGLAIAYQTYWLIRGITLDKSYLILIASFITMMVLSVFVGLINNADPLLIFEDVKPLSYFLILPFFAIVIRNEVEIKTITKLVIICSVILATVYLMSLLLINTGLLPFREFYKHTVGTGELFFRGEIAYFYKGFIFLCIGLILNIIQKPKYYIQIGLVLALAILLTFTRGFIFALLLTAFAYTLLSQYHWKKKVVGMAIYLILTLLVVFKGNVLYAEFSKIIYKSEIKKDFTVDIAPDNLLGDRKFSDNERKTQLKQVIERATFTSSIIGHGFGIGVPVRPVHMEISYLEIFHKQGAVGLLFWLLVFVLLTRAFLLAKKKNLAFSESFYYGSLFLFIQSVTNQYFNNPIGMSFILISLVSLNQIANKNE